MISFLSGLSAAVSHYPNDPVPPPLTSHLSSPSTRHIFFTHVKEDLHNGHLRMCSEQAVELSALLAQAEFGDYNQNTAQYWYSELCGEEPSVATIDR